MAPLQKNALVTIDGRLESFKQLGWPHLKSRPAFHATPETLAQAGFYRHHIDGSEDNVACPFCRKNLDGWAASDGAWDEHASHSPTCPIVRLDVESNRETTFLAGNWPHENAISPAKMATAGFFYWPASIGDDDTAICVQCGLSLDGWDPSDNPRFEHERRRPKCPFLVKGVVYHPAFYEYYLASKKSDKFIREIEDPRIGPQATVDNQKPAHPAADEPIHSNSQNPSTSKPPPSKRPAPRRTNIVQPQEVDDTRQRLADILAQVNSLEVKEDELDLTLQQFLEHRASQKLSQFDREAQLRLAQFEERIQSIISTT